MHLHKQVTAQGENMCFLFAKFKTGNEGYTTRNRIACTQHLRSLITCIRFLQLPMPISIGKESCSLSAEIPHTVQNAARAL
jgi:hypothetical protein